MTLTAFGAVWTPTDHDRLLSMMDLLTAVQMDLSPLCGRHKCVAPKAADVTIADACELLQTAIDDLRGVIARIDVMVQHDGSEVRIDGRPGVQS